MSKYIIMQTSKNVFIVGRLGIGDVMYNPICSTKARSFAALIINALNAMETQVDVTETRISSP